jgi:hypothetical protein
MQQGVRNGTSGRLLLTTFVVLGSVSVVHATPLSDANRAKLAAPVQSLLTSAKPQRLIIQLQEPTPAGTLTQIKKAGARITRQYEFLPMVAANVPGKSIAAVAALPGVTRVSLDGPLSAATR